MRKEILEAAKHCCTIDGECYNCPMPGYTARFTCEEVFAKAIVEQHDKYRWHDLRKNPYDLPKTEGKVNVCIWVKPNDAWGIEERYIYDTYYFCREFQTSVISEVIGWSEIVPFEGAE